MLRNRFRMPLALVCALAALALVITGCGSSDEEPTTAPTATRPAAPAPTAAPTPTPVPTATPTPAPKAGGIFNTRNFRDPTNYDLHKSLAEGQMFQPMYNNLIRTNPYNESAIEPDIATSYSFSADGKTATFKVRQGVKWHDGKPLRAEDVTYSLLRMAKARGTFRPIFLPMLEDVDTVQTVDAETVQVNFKQASPVFLSAVSSSMAIMLPEHIGDAVDKNFVGSGPFKLEKVERGIGLTWVKNQDYFVKGLPYLDGINQYLIVDDGQSLAAFRTGKLHWTGGATSNFNVSIADQLKREIAGLQVFSYGGSAYTILLNTKEPFTNPDVRRAIHLAIDRAEIVTVAYQGGGTPYATNMPSKGRWTLTEAELKNTPGFRDNKAQEIAEGRALMEKACFTATTRLKSTILVASNLVNVATVIASQLAKINMDVTLNSVDRASVTQRRDARQFDLYAEVLSAFADDPIVVYGAWFIPGATSNWAKYDIPEVTALYQEQLRILDQAQRLQKVKEMQRKSLDAAWWDPASESTVVHAFYAQVKDFPTASFGFFSNRWRFERVWLDR